MDTDLGKRINSSKIGIGFHTTWGGSTMEGMPARSGIGVDTSSYQGNDDISVFSSDFSDTSGTTNFTI